MKLTHIHRPAKEDSNLWLILLLATIGCMLFVAVSYLEYYY